MQDYGNPSKWGEPGFAALIVAICCLSSRHIDDPRVRSDPSDGNSAGTQWFELFGRLRTLPNADRPTVYTVQSVLVAGVYAVGLGKLSKAFALLAEAVTLALDTGLHRSADAYDVFDPIEDEVRKRTFWCIYLWDKQAAAHFGRPPMVRLRDCDVGEPAAVDDELITRDGIGVQPAEHESRMAAFVALLRVFVVLESILDGPPSRHFGENSPFLTRATGILSGFRRHTELREEEALLDDIVQSLPPFWAHTVETMASGDVLRVTQAVRIHCAEQFVRMLLYRHRFSEMVADRAYRGANNEEQSEAECEAMGAAQACAVQIISSHMQIATKGLMTYCEWLRIGPRRLTNWTSRWRPCHSSAHRRGTYARRDPHQLPRRVTATADSAVARGTQVVRWAAPSLQWAIRLRSSFRGSHGGVLST